MTTVFVVKSAKKHVDHVLALDGQAGLSVCQIGELDALKEFQSLALSNDCFSTFVVDISSVSLIQNFITIAKQCYPIPPGLRLIVVADFSTWAKTHPKSHSRNLSATFRLRRSCAGKIDEFSLENELVDIHQSGILPVQIVYLGLVYGGAGHDFKEIFSDIWFNRLRIPADDSPAFLAHIHFQRLRTMLRDLLVTPLSFPGLVPAFDSNALSMREIMQFCNTKVNGASCEGADARDSLVSLQRRSRFTSKNDAFVLAMQKTPTQTINGDWDSIWGEFLQENSLRPVTICVSGPPKTGKTEHARALAQHLQLQYVDVLSAVRFLLNNPPTPQPTPEEGAPPAAEDPVTTLRTAVLAALDGKANEAAASAKGKGKDKGAAPVSVLTAEGAIDDALLTLTLVLSALSAAQQQQCIADVMQRDVSVQRRGAVLDIWEYEGLQDLSRYIQSTDSRLNVDVVVDLTCDDKVLLTQLQESYGAGFAKNKDAQAAYKNLEAFLGAYSALCTADVPATGTRPIHATLATWLQPETMIYMARDISQPVGDVSGAASNQARAQTIANDTVQQFGTGLGWCRTASSSDAPAAAESNTTAEPAAAADDASAPAVAVEPAQAPSSSSAASPTEKAAPPTGKPKGLDAMNAFLTETVLPVLAEALVAVHRETQQYRVADPIAFVAQRLLQEAETRQQNAEEDARRQFELQLRQGSG